MLFALLPSMVRSRMVKLDSPVAVTTEFVLPAVSLMTEPGAPYQVCPDSGVKAISGVRPRREIEDAIHSRRGNCITDCRFR